MLFLSAFSIFILKFFSTLLNAQRELEKARKLAEAKEKSDALVVDQAGREAAHKLALAIAELKNQDEIKATQEKTNASKLAQATMAAKLEQEIQKANELAVLEKSRDVQAQTLQNTIANENAERKRHEDQALAKIRQEDLLRQEKEKSREAEEKAALAKLKSEQDLLTLRANAELQRRELEAKSNAAIQLDAEKVKLEQAKTAAEIEKLKIENQALAITAEKTAEFKAISEALGGDAGQLFSTYLENKLKTEAIVKAPVQPAQPSNFVFMPEGNSLSSSLGGFIRAAASSVVRSELSVVPSANLQDNAIKLQSPRQKI